MNVTMPGAKAAPKAVASAMDTLIVPRVAMEKWVVPPFQRDLRINSKCRELAPAIEKSGEIPGVITLGYIRGAAHTRYILDGQHRRGSAFLTNRDEFLVEVRLCAYDNMAQMGKEYAILNSKLVQHKPDDYLRGLEGSTPVLKAIREHCPFVGYGNIRRGKSAPIVSMSVVIRAWAASSADTPANYTQGPAQNIASQMTEPEAAMLIRFLTIAKQAWGMDTEYTRLWGSLNLTLCMWLFRRMITDYSREYFQSGNKRSITVGIEAFKKCLMALSADTDYLDWLVGRTLSEPNRAPCYGRVKRIFTSRLTSDLRDSLRGTKVRLPSPEWAA